MQNVVIRMAEKRDLETLAEVEKEGFPKEEAASWESIRERFEMFPECFVVAEMDGRIVGYMDGCMTNQNVITDNLYEDAGLHDAKGKYQSVFSLVVLREYQHRGIARMLMEEFVRISKERGKKGMILTCKERLVSFYESFGYVNQGVSESTHGGAVWYDMRLELA